MDPRSNRNFRTSLKEGVIYAFKIARFNVILLSFTSSDIRSHSFLKGANMLKSNLIHSFDLDWQMVRDKLRRDV